METLEITIGMVIITMQILLIIACTRKSDRISELEFEKRRLEAINKSLNKDLAESLLSDIDLDSEAKKLKDQIWDMDIVQFVKFINDYREHLSDHCPEINELTFRRLQQFNQVAGRIFKISDREDPESLDECTQ